VPVTVRCVTRVQARATSVVMPPPQLTLRALRLVLPSTVRVVILGQVSAVRVITRVVSRRATQDPYHAVGRADGLAFSVQPGVRVPPSLAQVTIASVTVMVTHDTGVRCARIDRRALCVAHERRSQSLG
jgi:uracil DNA glycosylase